MTATTLRLMRVDDLPVVNALLIRAFSTARREEGFTCPELTLCRMEFLRFYQQDTPGSCWVAEEERGLCGAVFGHGWGRAGWIGPLAVSPECQKQGLGRALLERCAGALRAQGCRLIGLETDAASRNNIAFYSILGCTPGPLMVDLVHEMEAGWAETDPALASYGTDPSPFEARLPAFLAANGVEADYLHLARLLQQHRFGESYLEMEGDEVRLFAALQLIPVSVQERAGVGRIMAVVGPGGTGSNRLEGFIRRAATMAGCSHIVVRLSTWYPELVNALLRRKWRLINTHIRFYLSGSEACGQEGLHLNKWD